MGRDSAYRSFLKIPLASRKVARMSSECYQDEINGLSYVECVLPGPIKSGKSRQIQLDLDISDVKAGQTSLVLSDFEVFSRSSEVVEAKPGDNIGKSFCFGAAQCYYWIIQRRLID